MVVSPSRVIGYDVNDFDAGQPIKRRNAQLTHILVTGMWSPDASSTAPVGQAGKRVWVVKVVRREAVVSP